VKKTRRIKQRRRRAEEEEEDEGENFGERKTENEQK
jgi:hypothetical protein